MSWHRLVKIHKSKNIFIHFTLDGYDNAGLVSTLRKEGDYLILDFSTPLSQSSFFDKIIDSVLNEYGREEDLS